MHKCTESKTWLTIGWYAIECLFKFHDVRHWPNCFSANVVVGTVVLADAAAAGALLMFLLLLPSIKSQIHYALQMLHCNVMQYY